ncbi:MAG: 30S ribosomal protein S16 [Phycisphaerae bacterium]|nr:30S ribosomal protein S16 [Phycisphaerae bacterium]
MGRSHRAYYRLQAVDGRVPRDGRALEELGRYDPLEKKSDQFVVNKERVQYWLGVGAQPSATVLNLLKKHGVTVSKAKG